MSQFDFGDLSSPLSGTDFIDNNLEPWRDALHTMHSGSSRPSYAVAGLMWRDTTTTPWPINVFDGSADVLIGTLDPVGETFEAANRIIYGGSAGGTADVITLTPAPVMTAWTVGLSVYDWLATASNTVEGPTINISGQGAKTCKYYNGSGKVSVPIGGIRNGVMYKVIYDGTDAIIFGINRYGVSADTATAGTVNLDNSTGDYVKLTGTTAITAITLANGQERLCLADAAFTLTDSSGDSPPGIINGTGANIAVEAGDTFRVRGEASGTVRVVDYRRADGTALVSGGGGFTFSAEVPTTSGSSVTITTAIPSDASEIIVVLRNVSCSGNNTLITMEMGDGGGFETSGYDGALVILTTGVLATNTAAIDLNDAGFDNNDDLSGIVQMTLKDSATFDWEIIGQLRRGNVNQLYSTNSSKATSAVLTQLRLTVSSGTFDAGTAIVGFR